MIKHVGLVFLNVLILLPVYSGSVYDDQTNVPVIPSSGETSILRLKPLSNRDAASFYAHVADRIGREYVDTVDNNQLLEGALNGMLQALDPHSAYLDAKKFQEIQKQTHGEYGGLGLEITMDEGVVKVVSPIEDTPAFKANMKTGDLIIVIDDEPVYGMSIIEASEKMKGEPNTKVRLTIRRGSLAPFEIELTREKIKVHPVKSRIENNMAYLRITTVNEHTTKELKSAIQTLQTKSNNKIRGILIDVRNNAGGLLDQAVESTDLFLTQGEIVSIRGRDSSKDFVFKASNGDIVKGLPMVVLINGGSASASEILAGAIQDHKRGVIVGTKSFGKGSVQTVIPMTNGGAIKLTTALYYTPSGRSIQKTGITPDIMVEQQIDIKSINEEKRYREANLHKALNQGKNLKDDLKDLSSKNDNKIEKEPISQDPLNKDKEDKKSVTPVALDLQHDGKKVKEKDGKGKEEDILKDIEDYQLTQAFNILQALILQKTQSTRSLQ